MFHKHRWRDWPPVQNIQADANKVLAIAFWKESNRPQKTSVWLAQLSSSFGGSIVPHDCAALAAARLLESAQCPERARIINGSHQLAARPRRTQVFAHGFKARPQFAVAVKVRDPAFLRRGQKRAESNQNPCEPHARQISGARQLKQDDLVQFRVPVFLYPSAEVTPGNQTSLVVVRAVVGGARMRNINCNQRNASFAVLCCDNWGDILVGLKLDDQVHFFADQEVCIVLRDLRAVAVIEGNQFNPLRNRRSLQADGNLPGKLIVGSLCGIPEAIQFLLPRPKARLIEVLPYLFHHAAFLERIEQPKHHRLRQATPRGNFSKT